MGYVRREMEILTKSLKETLQIKKNTVTEMKNTNLGLISKLDTSKGKNL